MLHELAARRSERGIWWLHGARGPREHPFAAEVHTLLASLPHAREHVFYSAATPAERHRGHATAGRLSKDNLAGWPFPLTRALTSAGRPRSWPAYSTPSTRSASTRPASTPSCSGHCHRSTPASPGRPAGHPTSHPGLREPGPLVTFARSGISTPFATSRRSVLDLADACDIPTRWSCRSSVCHTRVTPLLSGDVSYRPALLEPPAEGQVLVCCAQPATDVVLDM
jgi:ferredoxin